VLQGDGSIREWVGVCTDITGKKAAEAELEKYRHGLEDLVKERTEELARSNKDLEQFAYVASHDLQEPLRMVQSYLGLVQRRYQGRLDVSAEEFIAYALDGAERMRHLIRDLLAISRVDTQGREPAPTDTGRVLNRVLRDLGEALREDGAEVTLDEMPVVLADESQLAQVFQNLVSNAVKFRSEQPCRVHIGAARDNGEWRFSVRDNGIGVPMQHADRIFAPFQRLHSRSEYPGTGIGLALCKKIVERHGGRIWVESQPGEQTTFWFTIPEPAAPAA